MKKNLLLIISMTFFVNCLFAGDVVTLNNNMVFNGKVKKIKGCVIFFKSEGNKYVIPASDIFSIQFENPNDKIYLDYIETIGLDGDNCLLGKSDAKNYHGKKGSHIALGVLFGPFAMIGTAIVNPTPEKGKRTLAMSENKNLFDDPEYLNCYKKKAKLQNITMEAIGWGAWILFALAFL